MPKRYREADSSEEEGPSGMRFAKLERRSGRPDTFAHDQSTDPSTVSSSSAVPMDDADDQCDCRSCCDEADAHALQDDMFEDFDEAFQPDGSRTRAGRATPCSHRGNADNPAGGRVQHRPTRERFVHGLQTLVGGLQMSQWTSGSATASMTSNQPPSSSQPLVMSRRDSDRPAGATEAPSNAPPSVVPGVSPGWHVASSGSRAMSLHAGVRHQDDDGWTPLDAFPAKTRFGKNLIKRLRTRKLGAADTSKGRGPDGANTPSNERRASMGRRSTSPRRSKDASAYTNSTNTEDRIVLPPIKTCCPDADESMTRQNSRGTESNHCAFNQGLSQPEGYSPKDTTTLPSLWSSLPASARSSLQFSSDPTDRSAALPGQPISTAPIQSMTDPFLLSSSDLDFLTRRKISLEDTEMGNLASPSLGVPLQTAATAHPGATVAAASSLLAKAGFGLQDLEVLETLGTGTFGRVLLVRLRGADPNLPESYFAMKVLEKSEVIRLKQVEHVNSEKQILGQVSNPFLVNLFCTFQDSRNCYMLMEYVVGGEIFSYLRRAGRFTCDVARFYISTIVIAIEYLHSRDIVYRDLKPENLLIDDRGYTKITDFGFAKRVKDRTWTLCGTPEYLAPEIIQSQGHGKAVDWWALGILLFEMLAGYPPFYDQKPIRIYEKILQNQISFPDHIDPISRDLIRSLLTTDRSKRLGNLRGGAGDVKNHTWFQGVDWAELAAGNIRPPIIPFNKRAGDTSNFSKYAPVDLSSMPGLIDEEADRNNPDPHRYLFPTF
ncbi:Pkinase-domain-containing protein [Violaceomyces palustris]|uniref:Pkinase-domain-containing protein n=1 Tax=Violaceomyces palustris TaxID=1673888 RepID=A0ACD0P136_9BASI|nr:Pkinase-domain-containing protein [Violaceomyces palustris]